MSRQKFFVYSYDFPGGESYIGSTAKPRQRDLAHRRAPGSHALAALLKKYPHTKLRVRRWHYSRAAATRSEDSRIAAAKKPVNIFYTTLAVVPHSVAAKYAPKKKRPHCGKHFFGWKANDAAAARCSWCRRVLPAENFNKDGSRYNGLRSRCKKCVGGMYAAMRSASIAGKPTAPIYAAAKAANRRSALQ